MSNKDFKHIGKYCRYYRMNVLKKTLKEVEGSFNVKALSAFEHGRSTNINHLLKYVKSCKNYEQKIEFLQGIVKILDEER